MKHSYNGWLNYETYNVALWLEKEETSRNDLRTAAKLLGRFKELEARDKLVTYLKDYVEDLRPPTKGMFLDLLNAALSEVDWYEVAEFYLAEVAKADALV